MHSQTILTIKTAAAKAHVPEAEIRDAMKSGQLTIVTTKTFLGQNYDPMGETPEGGPFIKESNLSEWREKRAFGSRRSDSRDPLLWDFVTLVEAAQARWHGPDGDWEGAIELLDSAASVLIQMQVDREGHDRIDRDVLQSCADRLRKAQDYCEAHMHPRAEAS